MKNIIRLKNVTSKKENKYTFENNSSSLSYEQILKIIKWYEPTSNPKHISIQYFHLQTKKWLMVYQGSPAIMFSEEQLNIIPSQEGRYRERTYSWENIQCLPRILEIRYKIYNQPTINTESIVQISKQLSQCFEKTKEFETKFDGETIDINLLWAGPYFTRQKRNQKGLQVDQDKNILKYSVNYRQPIDHIVKTIKQSNKRIHLRVNQFDEKAFDSKNEFSIVYLICHTEEVEIKPPKQQPKEPPTFKDKIFSKSEEPELQIPTLENKIYSVYELGERNIEIPQLLERNKTVVPQTKPPQEKVDDYSKKSESSSASKIIEKQTYFVGENKDGEMVKISPEALNTMLQNKQIKLLILHTSYPYYHYPLLVENPKIENILMIQSSPIYIEKVAIHYLQTFFKNLLTGQKVRINQKIIYAHKSALKEVSDKYQKAYTCCCYHSHKPNCTFQRAVQLNKFEGYHYRLHNIRCQCQNSHSLNHYCDQKKQMALKQFHHRKDLKNLSAYTKKKPLYFCCCERDPSEHHIDKKFILKSKSSKKNNNVFQFKQGDIKGDVDCLEGFKNEDKLIGNKKVIVNLLQNFVRVRINDKNCIICNIYGPKASGKKILTDYFRELVIRKKIFKNVEVKRFRKFKDLDLVVKQHTLYYLIYNPKQYNKFDNTQYQSLENLTNMNIKAILITQEKLQLKAFGQDILSLELQPFDANDCKNYFKSKVHMTQKMKDKVHSYFKLTWKKPWKHIYYPDKLNFNAILSEIAQSPYIDNYEEYLGIVEKLSLGDLFEFILFANLVTEVPFYEADGLESFFNQKQAYHGEVQINVQTKGKKMSKNYHSKQKDKYHDTMIVKKNEIVNISQTKIYHQLLYQRFSYKIKEFCLDLLNTHVYLLSRYLQQNFISLYDATTDDPGSLINLIYGSKLKSICEERQRTLSKNNNDLHYCLIKIEGQYQLSAGLKLVKQFLQLFYLYDMHQNEMKQEILESCLLIINFGVIFRKGLHNIKEQEEKEESEEKDAISNDEEDQFSTDVKKSVRARKNSIQEQLSFSYSSEKNKDDHQQRYMTESVDLSLHRTKLSESLVHTLELNKNKSAEQEDRKGQKDLIINYNLLSRKGLLYLLDQLIKKDRSNILKVIGHSFKLQLILEQIYENHHIPRQLIQSIDTTIKQAKKKISKIPEPTKFKRRFDYDMGICLILKNTLGGRKTLKKQSINQLTAFTETTVNPQSERNYVLKKEYDKIILQLCEDKQIYNKMTDKLLIDQRYCDEDHIKISENLESEITVYRILVQFWDDYYRYMPGKNKKTSKDCYFAIVELIQKLPGLESAIKSSYLHNFYLNLKKVTDISLKKLRSKMFVLFVANPVSNKKQLLNKNKFLINFNQILQEKHLEARNTTQSITNRMSRTQTNLGESALSIRQSICQSDFYIDTDLDLHEDVMNFFTIKMKLNRKNIELLQIRYGCKYIAVCVDANPNNNTMLIGEQQNGDPVQIPKTQLAAQLQNIPSLYFFICLPKSRMLADQLISQKKKTKLEMVYFNFKNQNNININQPEQHIIMIKITVQVIKRVQNGMLFRDAVNFVLNNMKIVKIKEITEQEDKNKNKSNKDIKAHHQKKGHKNKTEDILPSNEKNKSHATLLKRVIMDPQDVQSITSYSNSNYADDAISIDDEESNNYFTSTFKQQMIITNQYLTAIHTILQKINESKGFTCEMNRFMNNFEFYLKQKHNCNNFVVIKCNKGIFQEIINRDVMSMYYSPHIFVLVFQNYSPKNCDRHVNEEFQYLFLEKQAIKIEAEGRKLIKHLRKFNATFKNDKKTALIILCLDIEEIWH